MVRFPQVRNILYRAHVYYRLYGAGATAQKIASRLLDRVRGNNGLNGSCPVNGFPAPGEVLVQFHPGDIVPVGPLTATRAYVQEIEVSLTTIEKLEILLATYKRKNTSRNEIAIYSSGGRVLHREEFDSRSVRDNEFYRLALKAPIDLGGIGRFFLVLRSADGTRGNCITAWRTRRGSGQLFLFPAGNGEPVPCRFREQRAFAHARRLWGSLVYRIRGETRVSAPLYRLPPPPAGFLARCATEIPRVTVYGGDVSRRRDMPGLLAACGPANLESATSFESAKRQLEKGSVDVLVLADVPYDDFTKALLEKAHAAYVPTAYYLEGAPRGEVICTLPSTEGHPPDRDPGRDVEFSKRQAMRACSGVLCGSPAALIYAQSERKRGFLLEHRDSGADAQTPSPVWRDLLGAYRSLHRPLVSIVGVLYRKERKIRDVLESYFLQSYEGDLEVILVDDCTPDNSVEVVRELIAARGDRVAGGGNISVRVVRNDRRLGNCTSRNIGIRQARGDIIVVMDADCMINRDFILRHVQAHAFDDCEVVIGPMNIGAEDADPQRVLQHFERHPEMAVAVSALQDTINWASFLNCGARNLSIKASAITEDLFDPRFTDSTDPESGTGWEDVEMGYRLYEHGARIKFAEDAVSVRIADQVAAPDQGKPARAIKNLSALFRKHPELALVARRWAVDTWRRVADWADLDGLPHNEARMHLDGLFAEQAMRAPTFVESRRLRILTYRWHVSHQYELYKLPFDFTLVTGFGNRLTDAWDFGQRPMPRNARFRMVDQVDPEDFDLAIMHFDENVLSPENTNGVIGREWGTAFKWFRDNVNIPRVAICHGTPQFFGQYNINYDGPDLLRVIEPERIKLVEYLGDIPVVLNSHQAQREWGFRNSRVIWHGFDPTEFPPATYEKGILAPLGPLVMSRPHYRGYFLLRQVFEGHEGELRPETLRVPDPHVLYEENAFAVAKYRNCVDEIRRYSVYFNPTLRSPMPRARGEPMMCGVATVSANNHDVDMFIKNGINGFFSNDPDELRGYLFYLLRNPEQCRKIGAAGRETAMKVFNHGRFLQDWRRLVDEVVR